MNNTLLSLLFFPFPIFGLWRGEFTIRDGIKAPFTFEVQRDSTVILINGSERFETGKFRVVGDSLFVPLDQFDNELALKAQNNQLSGVLRSQNLTGTTIPLVATKGKAERFKAKEAPAGNITGRYALMFQFESGKTEESVAVFTQDGNKLTGTFLKPSGDARFLEGIVEGNRFYLSSFIGSSPGYYQGTIADDSTITGFQAGSRVKHIFKGKKDANAKLASAITKDGGDVLTFSLPDMHGNIISLADEKFRNKVVILAITGTWCPNCIDEAAFLSPWYKENRDRGVEIVTIHFERQEDTAFARKVMSRFRKRFDITYDQVFAGLANANNVKEKIRGLDSFASYPTTIFIGKDGRVSKIHSGYSGPATGKFYDEFVKEFNNEVDRLLKQ